MIAYKTSLEKLPENCKDCTCHWCRISCKKSTYEPTIKKEYWSKRHENCPLIETNEGFNGSNNQEKIPFVYKDKLYFATQNGKIYEKHGGEVENPSEELMEVSRLALACMEKD